MWFPVGAGEPARTQIAEAKRICSGCPSRQACLEFALAALPCGVAGGLDEDERADLRAKRAVAAWDAPKPQRHEVNPLDSLSAEARDALIAAGPRGRVPDGTPLSVRRELVRSALAEEFIASGHSGQQGGVRATQRGRDALAAYRRREQRAETRVTEQLGLPIAGVV